MEGKGDGSCVFFFLNEERIRGKKRGEQQEEFFEGRLVPVACRMKAQSGQRERERGNGGREISATPNT